MSPFLFCWHGRTHCCLRQCGQPESGRRRYAENPAKRLLNIRIPLFWSEKTFPPLASSGSSGTFSQSLARRVRARKRADIGRREVRGSRACERVYGRKCSDLIYHKPLKKMRKNFQSRFLNATTPAVETPTAHRRCHIEQETEVRHVET